MKYNKYRFDEIMIKSVFRYHRWSEAKDKVNSDILELKE